LLWVLLIPIFIITLELQIFKNEALFKTDKCSFEPISLDIINLKIIPIGILFLNFRQNEDLSKKNFEVLFCFTNRIHGINWIFWFIKDASSYWRDASLAIASAIIGRCYTMRVKKHLVAMKIVSEG